MARSEIIVALAIHYTINQAKEDENDKLASKLIASKNVKELNSFRWKTDKKTVTESKQFSCLNGKKNQWVVRRNLMWTLILEFIQN